MKNVDINFSTYDEFLEYPPSAQLFFILTIKWKYILSNYATDVTMHMTNKNTKVTKKKNHWTMNKRDNIDES
jgi:hypothetical protein